MLSRFLRRDESPAKARIGVALGVQGMLAVRVEQPFGARPKLTAAMHQAVSSENDWPGSFRALADSLSGSGVPTVVQVHTQLASLLQLTLPDVPEAERASALKFRARELSPIPLDDMALDYVEIPGMRMRGGEASGYCAVARLSQMRALRDAVKESSLRLEAIDVKDMALRHILARVQKPEENGALFFAGSHGARIIIARGDRLYLFRTSNLTAALLQNAQPERIETLLLDIQRTLDFYDSNFTDPPPRQLWLMPGWGFMPSIESLLTGQFRFPVRALRLAEVLDGAEQLDELPADLAALAVGAALRPSDAA
ncbi:MAG: hypothetical protein ACOZAQ_00585 [Pseudomonadota bacterium]